MAVTVMMMVMMPRIDADHMMVMPRLRLALGGFIADDPRAVLAQLAIHRRIAVADLQHPLDEGVEHLRMVAQIRRRQELDRRMARRDRLVDLIKENGKWFDAPVPVAAS